MFNAILATIALLLQVNTASNPYRTIENFFKLPEGRAWGSTSAVEVDRDGRALWVAERCTQNSCLDRATGKMSDLPSVLKFDASGKLVKSFGQGMLIFPHGITVDPEGNLWVTDGQDNGAQAERGAPPRSGPEGATKGYQVYKFSPDGKLLMTLGKAGGAAAP
jgi:streptogramin lyase